jgi:hypothetical protein
MHQLTEQEMSYISQVQTKYQELIADKNSRSEDKNSCVENTKAFWEYIEKKYGVDISKLDSIAPDGTMIFK